MKRRLLFGFLLVATLLTLRSAVLSCGIEQTWIPGLYDGGDTDNVLALSSAKAIDPAASPRVHSANTLGRGLAVAALADPQGRSVVADPSRAPPLL
jgi:hypothetical protein